MTHAMSDIHGQYGAYKKMLDLIRFSKRDTLYILGDVLDRGKYGIAVLMDIMARDNAVLLRGNHEQILIDLHSDTPAVPIDHRYWLHELGGQHTQSAYLALEPAQREDVLAYLKATPLQLQTDAGNWRYHLVHGYPDTQGDLETILWDRYEPGNEPPPLPPGTDCIVFGHTPTDFYTGKHHAQSMKIHWNPDVPMVGIDCGCARLAKPGRLGCLCLDNRQEFYIDI